MPRLKMLPRGRSQAGGVTILVALMLLVLLTAAAVAMTRNSLREIATAGFGRQGAMARNMADSGLEWSINWMDAQSGAAAASGTSAARLAALKAALVQQPSLAGIPWSVASSNPAAPSTYSPGGTLAADLQFPSAVGVTQGFTLGLTYMGKLPLADRSQGVGTGGYSPAAGRGAPQAPDLWCIRSDAQVIQGPVTFIHAREVWVSTPVQ